MTISLHRLTRTFMEFLSCHVLSSFPKQGVTSYSSYTLQRCVTLPMRDQLLVAQPGVLSHPQFHDVGPSSWSKTITALSANSYVCTILRGWLTSAKPPFGQAKTLMSSRRLYDLVMPVLSWDVEGSHPYVAYPLRITN